jgi:hypothetical protein
MDDFNQLAYLYLKRKRISVPKTKLLKQTVKDDFYLVFKSVMNVFNFLQFDTDDKSLVKKYRIQFIQNFYDQFIENESFHHSLDLDNLKNKQYFEHFGDLLMTFNLKLSAILKYYLKVTKNNFSTEDLNIIIFFILILKCNSDFQMNKDENYKIFNIFG